MLHENLKLQIKRALNGEEFEWDERLPFNWALDYFDKTNPDLPALYLMSDSRCFTYGELIDKSNILAHHFENHGLNHAHSAMVIIDNSPEYYYIALALIKLNVFFVPCYSGLTNADFLYRKSIIKPDLIITDNPALNSILKASEGQLSFIINHHGLYRWSDNTVHLEGVDVTRTNSHGFSRVLGNYPMMGTFTSGTSGLPKLAVHSHTSWPVGHLSSVAWQGINEGDLRLNVAHTGWAKHAWSSFFVPFNVGACVAIPNAITLQPATFVSSVKKSNITSVCAPPSFWRSVVKNDLNLRPHRLTNITAAGERLDKSSSMMIESKWGLALRSGYGQSEATAMIGDLPNGDKNCLLPGYRNAVLSSGKNANEGILSFPLDKKPIGVMIGYKTADGSIKQPDLNWFITGDWCKKISSHHYELQGRESLSFKSYDYLVSPEEIEARFMSSGLVEESYVYKDYDENKEPVPSLLIVPANESIELKAIHEWKKSNLASIYRIKTIRIVNKLPKTINGKIDRKLIQESLK